jgi:ornithine carbamoyltransferase
MQAATASVTARAVERDRRSLLTLATLEPAELRALIDRACAFRLGATSTAGRGRVVGTYFAMTSTRTRTSFAVGAARLGANVIAYRADDLQLATGESTSDTGRVLAGMLDALVVRSGDGLGALTSFSAGGQLPVVNAMSPTEHPTQAIADLATLQMHIGSLEGWTVLYLGEGNSTAAALALGFALLDAGCLELRTPPGYGLAPELHAQVDALSRGRVRVVERHDMDDLPAVDAVYTTQWRTTGTTKPDPDWMAVFRPFALTRALVHRLGDPFVLHDLPARRGEEVESGVLEHPRSIVFDQANMKLHGACAVLERALAQGHHS